MEELTGLKAYIGNDANVAALGEMWKGGGAGEKRKRRRRESAPARQPSVKLPASPLDVISEKVGQIIKTARESRH